LKRADLIKEKIFDAQGIVKKAGQWRAMGANIVFTNGVFDLLHKGHLYSLSAAAAEADYLIVAINSDASVKRLKGESRPLNNEESRALVLASLVIVDAVVVFNEDTPREIINLIKPDVLVKGGDYRPDEIIGAKEVLENGGRVVINPILAGFSTTAIIKKIEKN
jgi:rfaE bifunctional protein nucleotidyltransferase chain/domain